MVAPPLDDALTTDRESRRLKPLSPLAAYVTVSGAVAALMAGHTTNHLWSGLDFWVWLGPVREFAARPFHPTHPLVATSATDLYMGPYTFAVGVIVRATGLDALSVLAWAGMVNLLLLLAGIWFLSRCLSPYQWSPLLLLIFTLVAWGWAPWRWSGYPNMNSLGTVLPLGSTAAYGLALFFLGLWWRWLNTGRRRDLSGAFLLLVTVLLTHQMTAFWAMLVAGGFFAPRAKNITASQWRDLVFGAGIGLGLIVAWPYYSLLSALGELEGFNSINAATYRHVLERSVLALPGAAIIVLNARAKRSAHITIAFAVLLSVFTFGAITDRGSLGRVFPGVMLLAHIAMADTTAKGLATRSRSDHARRWYMFAVSAIVMAGLLGTAPGWIRSVPRGLVPDEVAEQLRLKSYIDPNRAFATIIESSDVVVAASGAAIPIGGGAAKVISVPIPEPFIEDLDARNADTTAILDPDTSTADRDRLLAKYEPDWLVVETQHAEALLVRLPEWTLAGEINGFVLLRPSG